MPSASNARPSPRRRWSGSTPTGSKTPVRVRSSNQTVANPARHRSGATTTRSRSRRYSGPRWMTRYWASVRALQSSGSGWKTRCDRSPRAGKSPGSSGRHARSRDGGRYRASAAAGTPECASCPRRRHSGATCEPRANAVRSRARTHVPEGLGRCPECQFDSNSMTLRRLRRTHRPGSQWARPARCRRAVRVASGRARGS